MNPFIKIAALLSLFTILNSCNNNSVDPEPQPGRRDYVWTVDTINPGHESLYLGRMWGSSANDVWAVGSSSWSPTTIWHYNGREWRCDSIPRYVQPSAIFGFSITAVWLGNDNSTIWKYNGTQWTKYGEYKISGYNNTGINSFDGISGDNIYGVGYAVIYNSNTTKAVIVHYNSIEWQFVNIPETKVSLETVAIEAKSNVLVMSGTVYSQSGFVAKIYCWDGIELKELLSESGWSFVTKLGDEIFATLGSKIYKYSNKQLTLWKDNSGTEIHSNIVCGRNRNDFFVGVDNGIAHYNGIDFNTVFKTNTNSEGRVVLERGTIFEKDVFFIAYDYTTGKNFIVHGQLK